MNSTERELRVERVVNAPRELVFRMWSEPAHFKQWAAPKGFTVESLQMDFRVGGIYRICLRSPEGDDYWVRGKYREIVPLERFSLTNAWENEDGTTGPETLLTVSFEDRGQQTKLVLHQAEFDSLESRDGHMSGWEETLDQLPGYLKTLSPDASETER